MSAAMKAMERAWQKSFQRSSSGRRRPVKTTTLWPPTTASVSAPWCTLQTKADVGVGVVSKGNYAPYKMDGHGPAGSQASIKHRPPHAHANRKETGNARTARSPWS